MQMLMLMLMLALQPAQSWKFSCCYNLQLEFSLAAIAARVEFCGAITRRWVDSIYKLLGKRSWHDHGRHKCRNASRPSSSDPSCVFGRDTA
jgi:hypothetical protein